ncbi:MAG: HIT domain-containing protein [Nitrospiraceae bacterium]|nr:HIT domain-containing protein [Nitrospiraceae bacterium]
MADDCLFCKIAAGEIPSTEVYSDEDLYAFRDINPAAPSHVLLIPRKHIASLAEVQAEDAALLGKLTCTARTIAETEGLIEDGFRCVWNCGAGAGQAVFHIHMHILGGRPMTWPPG